MVKRSLLVYSLLVFVSASILQAQGGGNAPGNAPAAPGNTPGAQGRGAPVNREAHVTAVPPERILNASKEPQNWLTYHGNYNGQRHELDGNR